MGMFLLLNKVMCKMPGGRFFLVIGAAVCPSSIFKFAVKTT